MVEDKIRKKYMISALCLLIGIGAIGYPFIGGIWEAYQNKRNFYQFQEEMTQLSDKRREEIVEEAKKVEQQREGKAGDIVDPFEIEDLDLQNPIQDMPSDAYGFLVIPSLNVRNYIYLGADAKNLRKGIGQVEGTDLPLGGKHKRCVLAGHRGSVRTDMVFRHLDQLIPGDEVFLYTPQGPMIYTVKDSEIILPTENEKLLPKSDEDMVTLLTCHPYLISGKRLLVNCVRKEKGDASQRVIIKKMEQTPMHSSLQKISTRNHTIGIGLLLLWIVVFLWFIILCLLPKKRRLNK